MLATVFFANGTPMLLAGDEFGRTQRGNNNAYSQDNETSWFDWTLVAKHADVHRFVTLLAARRLLRSTEPERRRESLSQLLREAKRAWHGVKLNQPDWSPSSHSLALTFEAERESLLFYSIRNAYWEPLDFDLPPLDQEYGPSWRRWIDTSLNSPNDIAHWEQAPAVRGSTYRAEAHSVVVLFADMGR
jgi:isoamylase